MSVDIRQARYDELDSIAARFRNQAEQNGQTQRSLQRAFQSLQSDGWKGKGADAFFAEMEQDVFPALGRLRSALTTGDQVLRAIVEILRTAEQEAAAPFRGEHGSGPPVPAPFQGGYTFGPPGREPLATPEGTFDPVRLPHQVRGGVEVKNYRFASGRADAIKYEVDVGGRTIPVVVPKNVSHDGEVHTIHEVAAGLASLPESSRSRIKRVELEPKRNPEDAFWAREYGTSGFESYANADRSGVVKVFPTWGKHTQSDLDGALHHEGGHIISMQEWGESGATPRWNAWKAAKRKDPGIASMYAGSSIREDFAETYLLYHQVKGTPKEASARKWMGERFKIIDQIEAKYQ